MYHSNHLKCFPRCEATRETSQQTRTVDADSLIATAVIGMCSLLAGAAFLQSTAMHNVTCIRLSGVDAGFFISGLGPTRLQIDHCTVSTTNNKYHTGTHYDPVSQQCTGSQKSHGLPKPCR